MKYKITNQFGHVTHCFRTLTDLRDFDIKEYENGYMLVINYITEDTIYFIEKKYN